MNYIKSPLNYTGGKFKLLSQIVPLFPKDIDIFVDLFCGGANVGINIQCKKVIFNDKEKFVIELLNYFKENASENIEEEIYEKIKSFNLSDTSKNGYEFYGTDSNKGVAEYNKQGYKKLRELFNNGKRDPITFYTLLLFAFNNQIRFNSKGEFNMPVNKRDFNSNLKKNLRLFVDKLKQIDSEFYNKDFRELKIENLKEKDFIYIDPPYLITQAAYNENEGWTEKDEVELYDFCNILNEKNIKFALSNVFFHKGKENLILQKWAKNYNVNFLDYNYSNSNYHTKDKDKKSTLEVLVTNY